MRSPMGSYHVPLGCCLCDESSAGGRGDAFQDNGSGRCLAWAQLRSQPGVQPDVARYINHGGCPNAYTKIVTAGTVKHASSRRGACT